MEAPYQLSAFMYAFSGLFGRLSGGNRARYANILVLPGKAPEHGERGAVRHCAEHFLVRAALRHAPISRQSGRMGSKVRSRKGLEICKD